MVTTSSNTHADIFAAAMHLMLEQGEGGLRVDAVAAAAGCNKRLIYHYFGNREGLVAAVYRQQCQVLLSPDNGLSGNARHFLHQQLQRLWPEFKTSVDPDAQWVNVTPGSTDLQFALKNALVLVVPSLLRAMAGVKKESRGTGLAPGEWQKLSAELIAAMFDAETTLSADSAKEVSERSQTSSKPRYRLASASRVVD